MRCGRKIGTRVPMRTNSMCGNGAQPLQNSFELVVAEEQGIAAAQQHIAHFGVRFEIAINLLELGMQFLFAHAADDAAAGAVAAIAGATIGDEKEHAIRIAMHEAGHRHVRILAARVRHVVGRFPALLDAGNDLAANRAIRIVLLDQVEKMRRDRERELRSGEQDAVAFVIRQVEMLLQLRERGDAILELPFPVVPEFRRHVGPVTRRVGNEVFSVDFACGKSVHFRW